MISVAGDRTQKFASIFFDGLVPISEADEYVEITNYGSAAQALTGWVLIDDDDGFPSFTFPNFVLGAGQTIRMYTNQVYEEWGGFSFGSALPIWNNQAPDVAALYDGDGVLVSSATYPPGC